MIEFNMTSADKVRAMVIRGALELHKAARNDRDAARPAVVVPSSSQTREVSL